jgi:phospholipid/cholesterol/gamma-HCH transport system ATP-binding protein
MQSGADMTAVRVADLVVAFRDHVVLDHLSLEVQRGEILGFVGGSGSGKSVLLRTIIGLIGKRQGAIEVRTPSQCDNSVGSVICRAI